MRWFQRLFGRLVPADDEAPSIGISVGVENRVPDRVTPRSTRMAEAGPGYEREAGGAVAPSSTSASGSCGTTGSAYASEGGWGNERPSRLKRLIAARNEAGSPSASASTSIPSQAPPASLIGAGAVAVVRRLRFSAENNNTTAGGGGGGGTGAERAESSLSGESYSTASVVSTTGLMVIRSTSSRLADACADALDLKVTRCERAILILPVLGNLLNRDEYNVCSWALDAARYRAVEHEQQIHALGSGVRVGLRVGGAGPGARGALSMIREREPVSPPEVVVRTFCGDLGPSGGIASGVWPASMQMPIPTMGFVMDTAASTVAAATASKDSRPVILYLRFPVAILAIICALGRFQCTVKQRWTRHRGAAATIKASSTSTAESAATPTATAGSTADACITVDVYQGMPIVAVIRPQKRVVATHSRVNRDLELVVDVADVLTEFNTAMRP